MEPLIENYMRRIVDIFLSVGAKSLEESLVDDAQNNQGKLAAVIRFPGGFRLSVHAQVGVRDGKPDLRRYSMHFMDDSDSTGTPTSSCGTSRSRKVRTKSTRHR